MNLPFKISKIGVINLVLIGLIAAVYLSLKYLDIESLKESNEESPAAQPSESNIDPSASIADEIELAKIQRDPIKYSNDIQIANLDKEIDDAMRAISAAEEALSKNPSDAQLQSDLDNAQSLLDYLVKERNSVSDLPATQ